MIEVLGIDRDADRFQGYLNVVVYTSNIIPTGGRINVEINHNNVGDNGPWLFDNGDLYYDIESGENPTITSMGMDENVPVFKWLSGVKFYDLGSTWTYSVYDMDNINNRTWKPTNLTGSLTEYAISTSPNSTSRTTSSYWIDYTDAYNVASVDYIRDFTINIVSRYVNGNASVYSNLYDWVDFVSESHTQLVLIDTLTDGSGPLYEAFNSEDFRLSSVPSGVWNSQTTIASNSSLEVIGGVLRFPTQDFTSYLPTGNPDYSILTGDRTYIRKFWGPNSNSEGVLQFTFSGYAPTETDILGTDPNIKIEINVTGNDLHWLRLYTNPGESVASGTESSFANGSTCRTKPSSYGFIGSNPDFVTASNQSLKFTFGTAYTPNEFWVKITIKDNTVGKTIKLSGLNVTDDGTGSDW